MSLSHKPMAIWIGNGYCMDDPECYYEEPVWPCSHIDTTGRFCGACSRPGASGDYTDGVLVPWPCEDAPRGGAQCPMSTGAA